MFRSLTNRCKRPNVLLRAALAVLLFLPLLAAAPGQSAEARYAAIVIEADSGRVLYEINADTRNYPASLTKMMTLYLMFEALEDGRLTLRQQLPVSRRAAGMPASRLGLNRGETIGVETAIQILVTKSANDVAVVVAEALGKTEAGFARQMTDKANALGMTRTDFRNASGLFSRGQLSTARDMAVLARALMHDFPKEYGYFATRSYSYKGRTYRNHNKLLRTYAGTDGLKTGYIRASGYNLAASAKRDGRRLIAVVFGGRTGKSRDRQVAKLLDRGFRKLTDPIYLASGGKVDGLLAPPPPKPLALAAANAGTPAPKAVPAAPFSPDRGWGVQVGAYYSYAPAKKAAESAVAKLPDLLSESRMAITHVNGQRGRIYRARLVGLTEGRARGACRKLKTMKSDCLVLQNRTTVVALAN